MSLLPSATEIVCALGLGDRLVAVTHECDYPSDDLNGTPRITANQLPAEVRRSEEIDEAVRSALATGHGLYALHDAEMAQLQPDLILTQELCEVCAVAYPRVLEAARVAGGANAPMVVSLEPHSIDDVFATIQLVAELAGVEGRGINLVEELRQRVASLRAPAVRKRVALIEWLAPVFAPGHWVPDQIRLAGGDSVFGVAGQRSRQSTWEKLAEAEPDILVLGLCGFDLERTLEEWNAFGKDGPMMETAAWRDGQVWAIDGSAYVSRPGPRLVDGVQILNAILLGQFDERAVALTAEA